MQICDSFVVKSRNSTNVCESVMNVPQELHVTKNYKMTLGMDPINARNSVVKRSGGRRIN